MRTKEVIQDLLLSNSDDKDWLRKVLISSHIISRKDLNSNNNRNFFEKDNYNYLEIKNGVFKRPIILTTINKTITTYIIENGFKDKRCKIKRCIKIIGNNSEFKNFTCKTLFRDINNQDKNYGYLKENNYTILYFPTLNDTDNTDIVYLFEEISKNCYLIDSLSKNINSDEYKNNIRDGFTKKEVIEMILNEFFNQNET